MTLPDGAGSQTYVATGGGNFAMISSTTYQRDAEDRVTAVVESGVTVSETTYLANGDVIRTGRDGSVTRSENDGQRTVEEGVAAGAGWDAQADLVTETTELANGSSQTVVSAGGLSMTTTSGDDFYADQTGAVTTTAEANGGLTTIETGPGGITVTTKRYLDGQTKSVEGLGVVNRYHTYSVAGGAITETVHFGAANSPRWRKTKTLGGRVVETREPGPNGADYVQTYTYDERNGRTVVSRNGLAAQISERSGAISRSGLDMDGDQRRGKLPLEIE